ncbi:RNA-binding protein [Candidatus Woesearchaeota archaeon CG10_big_fil_rev_8_21_14_0_10_45_16]|nr:MAG: RNA-binding protein [Candidatus Woesearchaeota archaeon CG10_big_fil_rev_8_21_14_0_10_45_16]
MSNITVQERDVVIPGQVLAEGLDYLPGDNTYRQDDKIYARALGLFSLSGRVAKVTALSGPYVPKTGDKIIGQVQDILMSGWRISTGTAYTAMLNVKDASARFIRVTEDLSKILAIGDFVIVVITKVTSQNLIDLTMKEPGLRKINGGRIIQISSQKVPRVIGKKASMISVIKEKTGCEVTVGQNGYVWIKGDSPENECRAEQAIRLIEAKSHEEGLTDKIQQFLSK